MKIVHICLCGPMTDGLNYQENIITKYHKQMGFDVTIVASQYIWDEKGNVVLSLKTNYLNDDGVKIMRIPIRKGSVDSRLKVYPDLYRTVEEEAPDILFIHDCQFLDVRKLAKYAKKHPNITVYVDNHVDYSNGAHGWLSKNILHKGIWRYCVNSIEPYVKKFYGVLPARVDFLKDLYGLPAEKCELLVMGADDELVSTVCKSEYKEMIRKKHGFSDGDFLVVTGGKINKYRPETLNVMEAIQESGFKNIKLIVFGSVSDELKFHFEKLCESNRISFIGWQNARGTYEIMAAADLIVFPGLHSVMWEQAVALGVPCIFRDIEGFHHIDLGGNAILLKDVSKESLQSAIEEIMINSEKHAAMKACALEKGMKVFSYKDISKRSIEK